MVETQSELAKLTPSARHQEGDLDLAFSPIGITHLATEAAMVGQPGAGAVA